MQQKHPWWQRNNIMVPLCLGFYAIVFIGSAYFSTGTYGGGDSWMHYLFARYAFKHPDNFLDQWGKPVFTILASPWAQLGFGGVKLFNIICALITGYLSFLIARQHFKRYAWLSIVFVFSVPIYFVCVFSGLTEILFALFLVAGIYLYQNFRENWACVIISFLPFIRSEGFLIIPVFAFLTLYYRQYRATAYLATGTLVFSVVGFIIYGNWLWVFSTNPYLMATNVYGKGALLEFVRANENIAGAPQVFLILLAVLLFLYAYYYQWQSKTFGTDRMLNIRVVLIFGSFAVYFVAHSIFWKLGIFGSLGLSRVMAGIGPCIGLTAFAAFQALINITRFQVFVMRIITVLFLVALFLIPIKQYHVPYQLSDLEVVQVKSCDWIKQNKLENNFVYFFDPFVAHLLGLDKFDSNKTSSILYINNSITFRKNSIIIWDSQFCPVEGQLPKRWLDENKNFELLHEERNDRNINGRGDTLQIRIYRTLDDVELKNMK
jgi:hypothetical protein